MAMRQAFVRSDLVALAGPNHAWIDRGNRELQDAITAIEGHGPLP
jgi:hypothetical protein